jgi:hypothetical protein
VWQLTPFQLAGSLARAIAPAKMTASLKASLERYATLGRPFTADPSILNASPLFAAELVAEIRRLVDAIMTAPAMLAPCLGAGINEACVAQVIDGVGGRAFRRPLSAEEKAAFLAFFTEQQKGLAPPEALKLTLRRLLAAPEVFFRREVGVIDTKTGLARLSAHELADLVAYTLTDEPPDAMLRAAADSGGLLTPAMLEAHVRRLLDPAPPLETLIEATSDVRRRATGLVRFFREWLDIESIKYADGDERTLRWMDNEPTMSVLHTLWRGDGRLETLLSTDQTFYSNTLASLYKVPAPAAFETPTKAADGRRGLLMQAGWLIAHDTTTRRGEFIRSRLFCQHIKAPPGVDNNLDGLKIDLEKMEKRRLNPREVRARHMMDPQCATCHNLLDTLGFPFDNFDRKGLVRTKWDGFDIDTRGQILNTGSTNGMVANGAELAVKLGASADVRDCFVVQLYGFVHGRAPTDEDACYLDRLKKSFAASGGKIRELLVQMLLGDEMRARTPLWEEKK